MSDSTAELAEELRAAVGDFVRRIRVHDGMPPGQAAVLGRLSRGGPLPIAELARGEQVKHQSMTRTVNLLRDQGLVSTTPGETDRRQVVVTLTGAGADALDGERHRRAVGIDRALREDLTAEERELVRLIPGILRKLAR
ncbi:MarR family winged helix-turn-helix transcriptional regulator [Actinoplanes friuliensis]|uniref:Putative MarR-family transcriptional regulator n=1 Tax=Actinoplanes friuliensis DSM 7358 TaxID=1246995 RepID=U5W0G6_9ACTN|nr:MarR family transcriptional regulator [Actinoplanes friuliensis]AGZ42713.1 putative MarR-family transcriptional regulator [Actinoplanes friuliensis DSM 7358]